ncbi:hypothetical protein GCM10028805_44730 [Spirosoma harenae]
MNWWIILRIGQWLAQLNSPPEGYLMSDEAFFAQPLAQQLIVLDHPDTLLLNLALFQATNEARRKFGLPVCHYDRFLYQAARDHAESMMLHDYTSHEDLYNLETTTLLKRVQKQTKRFGWMAENIGQYQTIDTPDWYSARFNRQKGRYDYISTDTKQLYRPYTYARYARYAVQQWLDSPHHRVNLLNPSFTHVGCVMLLSANPYKQRKAPFGRVIQNFGAERSTVQVTR